METLLSSITWVLIAIGALAFLVSVITEVTKNLSVLKKVPTDVQVIILSMVLSVLALIIYCQYTAAKLLWYYVVAAVILSFIVAFVAMYGWEKLTALWQRFKYKKGDKVG